MPAQLGMRSIGLLLALAFAPAGASPATGEPPFSEWLRAQTADQWERVVSHRFASELAAGSLANATLRSYLVQDHRFVNEFTMLLAAMLSLVPTLDDRVQGAQFLALVTSKENTYFVRSLEALGVSPESASAVPDSPITTRFKALMRSTARGGSLANMLAVLLVCEWSYETWGERAMAERAPGLAFWHGEGRLLNPPTPTPHYPYQWIDLHAGAYFNSVIAYLRGLLDREGAVLDEVARREVVRVWAEAVGCEEDFFDAAYSSPYGGSVHDEGAEGKTEL
ncbi:hypothetical protein T492DRAFT_835146 [Pavlovales sp. CCMP2436]|nr:hypothetical protein T492DRAFT_835146 [Pavlovales sp. CCMP2436]